VLILALAFVRGDGIDGANVVSRAASHKISRTPTSNPPDLKLEGRCATTLSLIYLLNTQVKTAKMKILTLNFLTCAVKACKSSSDSFPLHPRDAELVHDDIELNPDLLANVLTRVDWKALRTTSTEVSKLN
jgi:hypothetical protein